MKQTNSLSLSSDKHFTASPVGLAIADGVSYDDWQAYGGKLRAVQGALQWAIGDWLNYGEAHYGETYAQALELWPEHAYQTLRDYKWVSGRIELSLRNDKLSYTHHRAVAGLPRPKQSELLAQACAAGWTVAELRAATARAKDELFGPEETGRLTGLDTSNPFANPVSDDELQTSEFVAPPAPELLGETPNAPHVSYNSGQNEWYTPPEYIEAARAVMGGIDCDPASSEIANRTVKAKKYYTKETNGLEQKWRGRVWMNPPYASDLIGAFCDKLIAEYVDGNVTEAIVLVNNATETGWFNALISPARAVVFPRGRIRYLDEQNRPANSPLQGQTFIYYGDREADFMREFEKFGWGARR